MRIVLPQPAIADEFATPAPGDPYPEHDQGCGPTALSSALSMRGVHIDNDDLNDWLKSQRHNTTGGTFTVWLADACRWQGVPCSVVSWHVRDAVRTALAHGLPCVAAIYSDGYGTPVAHVSNIGHFVVVYGYDDSGNGTYWVANPGGARVGVVSGMLLEGSAQNSSLIVGRANASAVLSFGPAIPAGGSAGAQDAPMTEDQALQVARGQMASDYLAVTHRGPESVGAVDAWAVQLAGAYMGRGNVYAVLDSYRRSPEVFGDLALDYARDHPG